MSASREDLRAIMNRRRCGRSLTLANREHRVKSRNGFAQLSKAGAAVAQSAIPTAARSGPRERAI